MASIHKTESGWQVRWRDNTNRQQKQTVPTKKRAERLAAKVETELSQGTYLDPAAGRQMFSAFAAEWAAGRDWAPGTHESWPRVLARIVRTMGDQPLQTIDMIRLQGLRAGLGERGYSVRTINTTLNVTKAIMRAAYASGRIVRDPTIGVEALRQRNGSERVGPEQVPTSEEVLDLIDATPDQYRAAVALGACGLRIGEVLGLQHDRLHLDRGYLVVDQQLQEVHGELVFVPPKGDKCRDVRLPSPVVGLLHHHLYEHQGAGLLFRGRRSGTSMRRSAFYGVAWQPALSGAGLVPHRYKFHALRHFCASAMLAQGVPVPAVAGHIGDHPKTLMDTYAHWLRDDVHLPQMALESVLRRPVPLTIESVLAASPTTAKETP